jgi:hypothetical protein
MQSAMRSAGDVAWLSELVKSAHYQSPGPPAEGREAYYFSNGVMMYVDDIVQCNGYTSDLSPTASPYTKPATEGKDEESDDSGGKGPGDSEDDDEESAEWRRWWVRTALDHEWYSLKNLATARDGLLAARKRDHEEQQASLSDTKHVPVAARRPNHAHLPTSKCSTWGAIEAAIVAAAAVELHRGAVWNFSPDGPARAHARSVAMPRSTPGKPVGSVGPFPLPVSST